MRGNRACFLIYVLRSEAQAPHPSHHPGPIDLGFQAKSKHPQMTYRRHGICASLLRVDRIDRVGVVSSYDFHQYPLPRRSVMAQGASKMHLGLSRRSGLQVRSGYGEGGLGSRQYSDYSRLTVFPPGIGIKMVWVKCSSIRNLLG